MVLHGFAIVVTFYQEVWSSGSGIINQLMKCAEFLVFINYMIMVLEASYYFTAFYDNDNFDSKIETLYDHIKELSRGT